MKSLCAWPALLVAVLSVAAAASPDEWLAFKQRFGRVYHPEEERFRRQVFAQNLERIRRHNVEHDAGRSTFRLGVNQFADLTNEEFRHEVLSELRPAVASASASSSSSLPSRNASVPGLNSQKSSAPDSFDWRSQGVPITIRDQGQLGASWTIAVTSCVEDGVFISDGQTVSLSDQNLLDCVPWPSTVDALNYIGEHGVASEADYPTGGGIGSCRAVAPTAGLQLVHEVPEADEAALAEGLLQNPAPVMFDAGQFSFQLYVSGIYSDPGCSADGLNHAMLLVGYGTAAGTDFWTLANSWGTSWGEAGFVRVQRGVNMCGVASRAAYPTGVHLL